jgi:hypothetical protein
VDEQKERQRILVLEKVEDLLESVRDAYRGQETYLPAVRAIEQFRVRIIRAMKLHKPRKRKVREPLL